MLNGLQLVTQYLIHTFPLRAAQQLSVNTPRLQLPSAATHPILIYGAAQRLPLFSRQKFLKNKFFKKFQIFPPFFVVRLFCNSFCFLLYKMPKVTKKNVQKNDCYVYSVRWTASNTTDNRCKLEKLFRKYAKKWIYQAEEGKETKTPHFQGYCSMKTKTKAHIIVQLFRMCGIDGSLNITPASGNSETVAQVAIAHYVMKEDTRVGGPWMDHREYTGQDLWPEDKMPNWQKYILSLYRKPLDVFAPECRHVNWVYDLPGSNGKSRFLKFLDYKEDIPCIGAAKAADILCFVRDVPNKIGYTIDLTRTLGRDTCMADLYQAIESVQNGHFFAGKYQSSRVVMEIPRIWVMSNRYPDVGTLTRDRWKIWIFDSNDERGIRPMTMAERVIKEEQLANEREKSRKITMDRRIEFFASLAR